MKKLDSFGIPNDNGLAMLLYQGIIAYELWTGVSVSEELANRVYTRLRRHLYGENVVLTGYMGCGKSTVGQALAEKTGKDFLDTDTAIEEMQGCSICRWGGEEIIILMKDYDMEVAKVKMEYLRKCVETNPTVFFNKRINATITIGLEESREIYNDPEEIIKVADERMYYGKQHGSTYSGVVSWISPRSEFTPKTIVTDDERAAVTWPLLREGLQCRHNTLI